MIEITNEEQYCATLEAIERLTMMVNSWEPLPPGIDPGEAKAHADKVTRLVDELNEDVRIYHELKLLRSDEATSPRPWRVNPAWPAPGHSVDPSPILDANGKDVFDISEWCGAKPNDIQLIVDAVNAWWAGL